MLIRRHPSRQRVKIWDLEKFVSRILSYRPPACGEAPPRLLFPSRMLLVGFNQQWTQKEQEIKQKRKSLCSLKLSESENKIINMVNIFFFFFQFLHLYFIYYKYRTYYYKFTISQINEMQSCLLLSLPFLFVH